MDFKMSAVVILILFSTYGQFGNAIHCFDCQVDKMVDITKLNKEQIQTLFESSSCTIGGYAIGTDEVISCEDESAELSSVIIFNGSAKAVNVSKSVLYNVTSNFPRINDQSFLLGETQNSTNGECLWIRNHVDCAHADDDDRPTICDCRRPMYRHGCSGGHRHKMASWVLVHICAFILGRSSI